MKEGKKPTVRFLNSFSHVSPLPGYKVNEMAIAQLKPVSGISALLVKFRLTATVCSLLFGGFIQFIAYTRNLGSRSVVLHKISYSHGELQKRAAGFVSLKGRWILSVSQ